jgi:hypothetical protein
LAFLWLMPNCPYLLKTNSWLIRNAKLAFIIAIFVEGVCQLCPWQVIRIGNLNVKLYFHVIIYWFQPILTLTCLSPVNRRSQQQIPELYVMWRCELDSWLMMDFKMIHNNFKIFIKNHGLICYHLNVRIKSTKNPFRWSKWYKRKNRNSRRL